MKNLFNKNLLIACSSTFIFGTIDSYGQKDLAMLYEPCCAEEIWKPKTYNTNEVVSDPSEEYNLANDIYSKYYLKSLIVSTEALNLRKGPGSEYEIITTVTKYQKLVYLAMKGDWVKVRVNSSDVTGFVFYKHIVITNN